MQIKLIEFKSEPDRGDEKISQLIRDLQEEIDGVETLLVAFTTKEGGVELRTAGYYSNLELLGLAELAKLRIFDNVEYGG